MDAAALDRFGVARTHTLGDETPAQRVRASYATDGDLFLALFLLLVDWVQLAALALWPHVPWEGESAGQFAEAAVTFGLAPSAESWYAAFVMSAVLAALFTIILLGQEWVEMAIFLHPADSFYVGIWVAISVFCRVVARPMSALMLLSLVAVLDCSALPDGSGSVMDIDPTVRCWEGDHTTWGIVSIVALVGWVPMTIRFVRAHSRVENIEATWNVFDWSADSVSRPARRHPLSFCGHSGWHHLAAVLLKGTVVASVVLQTATPALSAGLGLAFALLLLAVGFVKPPFFRRDEVTNAANCAANAAITWLFICALLAATSMEGDPTLWTFVAAGCPAAAVLGAVAAYWIPWEQPKPLTWQGQVEVDELMVTDVEAGTPRRFHENSAFGAVVSSAMATLAASRVLQSKKSMQKKKSGSAAVSPAPAEG